MAKQAERGGSRQLPRPPIASRSACIIALLALVVCFGSLRVPAAAHTSLVSTTPEAGSTVQSLPDQVSATFAEDIDTGYLVVNAPNGEQATTGDPLINGDTIRIATTDLNISGTYALSYRVVSSDGHPIDGTIAFTVQTGREADINRASDSSDKPFVDQYFSMIVWGGLGTLVLLGILLWPLRRRLD